MLPKMHVIDSQLFDLFAMFGGYNRRVNNNTLRITPSTISYSTTDSFRAGFSYSSAVFPSVNGTLPLFDPVLMLLNTNYLDASMMNTAN